MDRVYICHPYSNDPEGNEAKCVEIARMIAASKCNVVPVAPQAYLPRFVSESHDRERAMRFCVALLEGCHEVWVIGERLSAGMRDEIHVASLRNIRIRCFADQDAVREYIKTWDDHPF